MPDSTHERRFFGMLVRRTGWRLSWPARLVVLMVLVVGALGFKGWIQPFLSLNAPLRGDYLVVEGWMPAYAIDDSTNEFKIGHYKKIITSGGQAKGQWSYEHNVTYALLAAEELQHIGFDTNSLACVPGPLTERDRTYHSALAVRNWLDANHLKPTSIDVLTLGAHARRSRMLFQEAMGDSVSVGVVCLVDDEYDRAHWWRSSEGVRETISESIAYFYAKLIFHPTRHPDEANFQ
ncbi:MAG TPA: ElyC/SanA/YdcF family protein [Verrucomicrobiae bacterium]|jgi:hypothetical protein|nr:ElyC/SanA/YdcF family protein [Verrucomicrobiae bacterium]